jgi:hypothetical protein
MTEGNFSNKGKRAKKQKPPENNDYDWRDLSKPRNKEDDVIVDGWRRLGDGTFERVSNIEEIEEALDVESVLDDEQNEQEDGE